MVKVIEFRPRETNGKRRTYEKAADVIPMPVRKSTASTKDGQTRASTLSDMLDITWPRATD